MVVVVVVVVVVEVVAVLVVYLNSMPKPLWSVSVTVSYRLTVLYLFMSSLFTF